MGDPTPRQNCAPYGEQLSIKHPIRFNKQEPATVSGQFNGLGAEGRKRTCLELAATAFWLL
jgi:hypothetical protein